MDWIRITVKTTTEGSDIISEILSGVSAGGVIIEDKQDIKNYNRPKEEWDYIDEELLENYEDEVLVRGFISEDENVLELEGSYILFEGDKQYAIDYSEEYGWVASDVTGMEFEKGALFASGAGADCGR